MRKSGLAVIFAVIIVSSVAAGGFALHLWGGGAGTSHGGTPPNALVASAAITSANVSSSYHSIFLVVKDTGSANLMFLAQPSVSQGTGAYCGTSGWNPTPGSANPISTGESVKGNCILEGSTLKPGSYVTVSVAVGFSDGSSSVLSTTVLVAP
ncbi:MAG TPA: hypothetical protein VND41_03745 [Nitrososphaerales archaeon]|nr:hypothetical protein [Nitrososphaerales archaeon]